MSSQDDKKTIDEKLKEYVEEVSEEELTKFSKRAKEVVDKVFDEWQKEKKRISERQ